MHNRLREYELEHYFQPDREQGSAQNADEANVPEETSLWQRGMQVLIELAKPKEQRRARTKARTSLL
jgi:hypothetical protein